MPPKKTDKKILPLEATFRDILVCEKSGLRPYIETFVQEPGNITEASLGTLAGIFEITDQSEDSSYVVNYLISVIKKEYYLKAKRGAVESLEAALHRANLALAKLAEHGNVNWIEHLNAIIFVIEKRNVHLSQSGNAHAFLLRGKVLTDITDEEKIQDAPNPLKTFVDVLSGRLERDDRLIVTTDEIFDIFSFEEIKRSAIKFSPEEFTRFLHTALVNELERAAVLVIDLAEKEEDAASAPARRPKKLNAFSQQAFSKTGSVPEKTAVTPEPAVKTQEKEELTSELKDEMEKNNGNFVDKKTGHIYIKEDQFPHDKTSKFAEMVANITTKTSDLKGRTFKNLGTWSNKARGINWTGFFLEEDAVNEEEPFQPEEKSVLTNNISAEEARSILSEVRATEIASERNRPSRYKNYLKAVKTSAAPVAQATAAKFARVGGGAFAQIKSVSFATSSFISQNSKKATPFFKEKLARIKLAKTTPSEKFSQKDNQSAFFSSIFKPVREKSTETFRSGENIAKKLGGRKLSELKSTEEKQSQLNKTPLSIEPKPTSLDITPSLRPNLTEPKEPNQIIPATTESPTEKSGMDIQPSASPNEPVIEKPSHFVDSRRIGNIFSRDKEKAVRPLQSNPPEEPSIRVAPTVSPTKENLKREVAIGALPNFGRIKSVASRFDYSQKLYAILAVIFLLIVPYFIVRWQNSHSKTSEISTKQAAQTETPTRAASDSDTSGGANHPILSPIYSGKNIARLINLNGKIFAVSENLVADIQNKTTYSFPGDFGTAKISLGLNDLNLIFFINAQNQMLSWSPVSPKFQPETLKLPANATVSYAKTYLTYLYILDQKNNQIYRYPRTANGFTDETNWLRANADFSQVSDMAVNGNVFLTNSSGNLTEYFQGKKQNFQITANPAIVANDIYAQDGDKYIYILDKTNSRVIKLDPNGNIISQYADASFKNAVAFAANEQGGKIYITDGTQVESFSMNQ